MHIEKSQISTQELETSGLMIVRRTAAWLGNGQRSSVLQNCFLVADNETTAQRRSLTGDRRKDDQSDVTRHTSRKVLSRPARRRTAKICHFPRDSCASEARRPNSCPQLLHKTCSASLNRETSPTSVAIDNEILCLVERFGWCSGKSGHCCWTDRASRRPWARIHAPEPGTDHEHTARNGNPAVGKARHLALTDWWRKFRDGIWMSLCLPAGRRELL